YFFFFSSRRRHTRSKRDWSSDVCSSDLEHPEHKENTGRTGRRQILRVLGELRLISNDVIIPERSGSPVYTPLRDRVMYCVYSTRSEERRVGKECKLLRTYDH